MDARRSCLAATLVAAAICFFDGPLFGSPYRTENFVVTASDPAFARKVGDEAERFRRELAQLWLGHELPAWPQPCPITVEIAPHAGGETSFAFVRDGNGGSMPIDWRMKIFGPPGRILDSVLPHEVTHTIFATHFGRPLPRWADEGACTTVEHQAERERNHRMLVEFLTNGRGIPFNHMFAMKQYPPDILPLYSQGYSLARYLIMQQGHRHFVKFVGEGMDREVPGREPQTWNDVCKKYYGYEDLSDLQIQWLAWVKGGCPNLPEGRNEAIAANDSPDLDIPTTTVATAEHDARDLVASESWYVQQSRLGGNATVQRPGQRDGESAATDAYAPGSTRAANRDGTLWR